MDLVEVKMQVAVAAVVVEAAVAVEKVREEGMVVEHFAAGTGENFGGPS